MFKQWPIEEVIPEEIEGEIPEGMEGEQMEDGENPNLKTEQSAGAVMKDAQNV